MDNMTSSSKADDGVIAEELLDLDLRMNRCLATLTGLIESGNAALEADISPITAHDMSTTYNSPVSGNAFTVAKADEDILSKALAIVEQSEREGRKAALGEIVRLLDTADPLAGYFNEAALRSVSDSRINTSTGLLEYRIAFTSFEPASELGWLASSVQQFHRRNKSAVASVGQDTNSPAATALGMYWLSDVSTLGPGMVHASRTSPTTGALEYKISASAWEPLSCLTTLFPDDIYFIADRILFFHEQNPGKPRPEGRNLSAWCPIPHVSHS